VLLSASKELNAIVPSPEYVAAKIAFGNKLAMALFGARSETFLMHASSDKPLPPRDSPEAEASTTPIPERLIELAKKLQKLIDRQKQSDEKRR